MISQDMYDDLKAAYDATRELLQVAVSKGEQLQQRRNEQESTIRELKNELQVSAKSIDFWSDLAANNAEQLQQVRNEQESTIRQLRSEICELESSVKGWTEDCTNAETAYTESMHVIIELRKQQAIQDADRIAMVETIRQLRTELAETKQAMLLGVLAE